LIVGVKYCGGCNPRYERRSAYEKIKSDVLSSARKRGEDTVFETAAEGVMYDALLVICGCANRCAAVEQYSVASRPVYLWDEAGIAGAANELIKLRGE
jgi:hypothetical protein